MSNMILRSIPEKKRSTNRRARFSPVNLIATAITLFLVSLTFTSGLGVSGAPSYSTMSASAKDCTIPGFDPNDAGFAGTPPSYRITGNWPGGLGTLSPNSAIAGDPLSPVNVAVANGDTSRLTAYEWYGNAGMVFYSGTWFPESGCSNLIDLDNNVNSLIQGNTSNIGEVLLTVVAWALNANIIQDLITGEDAIITKLISGFQDNLYLNWFIPLIMLAAAAIGYIGLVKKRATEAAQGTIWVILSAAGAAIFFAFPTQIASWVDETVISVGNQVTQAAVGLSSLGEGTGSRAENICYIAPMSNSDTPAQARDQAAQFSDSDRTFRMTQCALWETFIYRPWAAAQFGQLSVDTPLRVPAEAGATFRGNTTLPLVFLDITVQNRSEVMLGEGPDTDRRDAQWKIFRDVMINDPAASIGHANFAGNPNETRFGPVVVGSIALLFGLGPLVFLSATLIAQQILMLLLLLLAPIALLIGVFPGRGRKIMLGWVEIFLSTVVKRMIAYVLIAVLLAAMSAVMTSDTSGGNYLIQVALVIAIGFGILNIRKIVNERFGTVSLGGDGGSFMQQNLQAIKQGNQQTKGIATGSVAGYANARSEDQGRIKSIGKAITGARAGAKTGGPGLSETGQAVKNASPKARRERSEAFAAQTLGAAKSAEDEASFEKRNMAEQTRHLAEMNWRSNVEGRGMKVAPSVMAIHGPEPKPEGYESEIGEELRKQQSNGVPTRPTMDRSNEVEAVSEESLWDQANSLVSDKIVPLGRQIRSYQDSLVAIDQGMQNGSISRSGGEIQKDILQLELMASREKMAVLEMERLSLELAATKADNATSANPEA